MLPGQNLSQIFPQHSLSRAGGASSASSGVSSWIWMPAPAAMSKPPQWVWVKPQVPNPLQSGFCSESHPSSATHYLFHPSPHWKKAFTIQTEPSPKLGKLHLLLRRSTPFHTGAFGCAHQIKPPQTQEDSLTARAASLLHKQERQFPSHTKDSYGIAANPCFPGI